MTYRETLPLVSWYSTGSSVETCPCCSGPPGPRYFFGEFSPCSLLPLPRSETPRCALCVPRDPEGRLVKEGSYQDLPAIPPLFVLGTSRGGSSLLWKCLVAAGVWMGEWIEDPWAADITSKGCSEAGMEDHGNPTKLPDHEVLSQYLSRRFPSFLDARRRFFPWGFNCPTLLWGMEDVLRLASDARIITIFREVEGWVEAWRKVSTLDETRFCRSHELVSQVLKLWNGHPRVLHLSLDEGHQDPGASVRRLADFTKLPLTASSEVWFAPRSKP